MMVGEADGWVGLLGDRWVAGERWVGMADGFMVGEVDGWVGLLGDRWVAGKDGWEWQMA